MSQTSTVFNHTKELEQFWDAYYKVIQHALMHLKLSDQQVVALANALVIQDARTPGWPGMDKSHSISDNKYRAYLFLNTLILIAYQIQLAVDYKLVNTFHSLSKAGKHNIALYYNVFVKA